MQITRRRFIGITAAMSVSALVSPTFAQNDSPQPMIWRGVALGANAELRLYHNNPAVAENLIQQAIAEVNRLENIFSVYRENSQISRLNRAGSLNAPSADLLAVLSQAQSIHSLTMARLTQPCRCCGNAMPTIFSVTQKARLPPIFRLP